MTDTTEHSGDLREPLRRPHRAPTGAGIKALRPLRGRAAREPWPRRLISAHGTRRRGRRTGREHLL